MVNFLDPNTWQTSDYTPIKRMIHQVIVTHPSQQQRIEGLVQKVNVMSRTNVGQGRRTVRVVADSIVNHTFNRESVDKKRLTKTTLKERKKIKRVRGWERTSGQLDHIRNVFTSAGEEVAEVGTTTYKEVFNHYRKAENKTSDVERKKRVQAFEQGLERPRKIGKNQRSGDVHVTANVGGAIAFIFFAKTRKNVDILREEIVHRNIDVDSDELAAMEPNEMKDLLKQDEAAEMARKDAVRGGISWTDITTIVPRSEAMQNEIQNYLDYLEEKQV